MATYSAQSLGIKPPSGGFQQGGWYGGRQFWGGTLSDPGQIHPLSSQTGAGQLVSKEVNLQSDQAQGNKPGDIENYLQQQRQQQAKLAPTPTSIPTAPSAMGTQAGMAGTGTGIGLGASGLGTQAPLNLPNVYNSLYESSGISGKEQELTQKEKQFLEAKGKISDNPFLSASMIDQRLQRLQSKYEEETNPVRSEIAQRKADIETQLNLQTKQFDINSQSAKDALSYFNTLLDAGALNSASGEDIAQITMMTGIPSSAINSAIKSKTATKADTQVITSTSDDGTVTVSTIDKNTGEVINQTSLGQVGNQQQGRQPTEGEVSRGIVKDTSSYLVSNSNSYGHVGGDTYRTARRAFVAEGGGSSSDFDAMFSDFRDPYNLGQYQLSE